MIDAVIVDDEVLVLDLLKRMLMEYSWVRIVGEFTEPITALKGIEQLKPDVVFLDIEMPEMNGIELGMQLLHLEHELDIVFVTAYNQYAIEAFKLNALHYILKPPDPESIKETLTRLQKSRGFAPMERVKITLFGAIHIGDTEDKGNIKWSTAKAEELFAMLILNRNKGVSKWQIIENLWPITDLKKAEQNLYTTAFRLKKTLTEAGISVKLENYLGSYYLEMENVSCDLFEFEDFMARKVSLNEAGSMEYERIISLYQGDLFGERAYSWCMDTREAYYVFYEKSVNHLLNYYINRQKFEKAEHLRKRVQFLIEG